MKLSEFLSLCKVDEKEIEAVKQDGDALQFI